GLARSSCARPIDAASKIAAVTPKTRRKRRPMDPSCLTECTDRNGGIENTDGIIYFIGVLRCRMGRIVRIGRISGIGTVGKGGTPCLAYGFAPGQGPIGRDGKSSVCTSSL